MSERIDHAILEKAARAIFDIRDDAYDMDEWEDIGPSEQELYLCQARAALEAAAPLIAAKALREAGDALGTYDPDTAQWLHARADAPTRKDT